MRAAVLEKVGQLDIRDVPKPECEDEGILIKVAACAVCGTDVKVYRHGHRLIAPPRIIGHELAGEIVAVGARVSAYKVGERVAVAPAVPCGECRMCRRGVPGMCDDLIAIGYQSDGGFAEFSAIPPRAVRNGCVNVLPEGLPFEEAALAEPLACCINAQELAFVGLGQTVAVIGAGPIGCLNVQLARARGATSVFLIDISADRLRMSSVVEPDQEIDASQTDPIQAVMDLTDGAGADVVITACSSGKAQEQALQMVAKRGVVNFFGGLPKESPYIKFDSNLPHYREFYVVGNHGSAPAHNRLAIDLIASGKIDVRRLITHRLPLERAIEGVEITEKGAGLKVIIKPDLDESSNASSTGG